MQQLALDQRLDRLGQHVVRARLFLDLWYYFEADDTRQYIIETMGEYSDFFRFTPHAYLLTYCIYIAGVFERRRDTINFAALIRDMAAGGHLQGSHEAAVSALISAAEPIAKKVTILRHNAFAHRTRRMSYNDVFDISKVTPIEMRELTNVALKLFNAMAEALGIKKQYFNELPTEDAKSMMADLAKSGSRQAKISLDQPLAIDRT